MEIDRRAFIGGALGALTVLGGVKVSEVMIEVFTQAALTNPAIRTALDVYTPHREPKFHQTWDTEISNLIDNDEFQKWRVQKVGSGHSLMLTDWGVERITGNLNPEVFKNMNLKQFPEMDSPEYVQTLVSLQNPKLNWRYEMAIFKEIDGISPQLLSTWIIQLRKTQSSKGTQFYVSGFIPESLSPNDFKHQYYVHIDPSVYLSKREPKIYYWNQVA